MGWESSVSGRAGGQPDDHDCQSGSWISGLPAVGNINKLGIGGNIVASQDSQSMVLAPETNT